MKEKQNSTRATVGLEIFLLGLVYVRVRGNIALFLLFATQKFRGGQGMQHTP